MDDVLRKYADKLVRAGLTEEGGALIGFRRGETLWNQPDQSAKALETVMAGIRQNAMIFAEPAEPYRTIIAFLADTNGGVIEPGDCETRMFLHDLPVLPKPDSRGVAASLRHRPGLVFTGGSVMACGEANPEQAFVTFSSICFACFVKFFSDTLHHVRHNSMDNRRLSVLGDVLNRLDAPPMCPEMLRSGPFAGEDQILQAMEEAGTLMVDTRLVDSNFGNISYFADPLLYISRKGGALDELHDQILPVCLDGLSNPPAMASTELPAHREIVLKTGRQAVLHGHPKFAVILSLDCEMEDCQGRGTCHLRCPQQRFVSDIPIVAGEPGAGPFGLCHTVPPALLAHPGVIVHGHGLFATGKGDFNEAFAQLVAIENTCRSEYLRRVG